MWSEWYNAISSVSHDLNDLDGEEYTNEKKLSKILNIFLCMCISDRLPHFRMSISRILKRSKYVNNMFPSTWFWFIKIDLIPICQIHRHFEIQSVKQLFAVLHSSQHYTRMISSFPVYFMMLLLIWFPYLGRIRILDKACRDRKPYTNRGTKRAASKKSNLGVCNFHPVHANGYILLFHLSYSNVDARQVSFTPRMFTNAIQ